ncbi:BolA family transcriptional regulator [Alphaproteobacteria bacterium]|nr:BolA family transcriptional regulator [Alphaproteobacteria bacterium]
MPVQQSVLSDLLERAFPESAIDIKDTMGDQDHYAITIVSPAFQGKRHVARHQMVYDALGGLMDQDLHALSLATKTPEEVSP